MKQLNLLPASSQRKERQLQLVGIGVAAAVIGAAAGAGIWGSLWMEQARLENRASAQVVASPSPIAGGAEDMLAVRVRQLNALAASEIKWVNVFELVRSMVPGDVTLNGLSITRPTADLTLQVSGVAPSNVSFAEFVTALRQDTEHFSSVTVNTFTYQPATASVIFSITVIVPSLEIQYTPQP